MSTTSIDRRVTLITAYYDLQREDRNKWGVFVRPSLFYFNNAESLFQVPNPIVIFCDDENEFKIRVLAKKYKSESDYKIIVIPFKSLDYYKFYDRIKEIVKTKTRHEPEFKIPEYNILMYSKTEFVLRVAKENYFDSKYFQWIDFGIHPNMLTQNLLHKHIFDPRLYKHGKLRCVTFKQTQPNDIKEFYASHQPTCAGTVFGGDKDAIMSMSDKFMHHVIQMLDMNEVNSDQHILFMLIQHHDPIYANGWTDMFSKYITLHQNNCNLDAHTLINELITKYNYTSYLECGTQSVHQTFNKVNAAFKECIEPYPKSDGITYVMTSDDAFKVIRDKNIKYDIIYIDGLHEAHQVERDIKNSLCCLNKGCTVDGCYRKSIIILDDTNPRLEIHTGDFDKAVKETGCWTGDVYRVVSKCHKYFDLYTIDEKLTGSTIMIPKYDNMTIEESLVDDITWQEFDMNRRTILNSISITNLRLLMKNNKLISESKECTCSNK